LTTKIMGRLHLCAGMPGLQWCADWPEMHPCASWSDCTYVPVGLDCTEVPIGLNFTYVSAGLVCTDEPVGLNCTLCAGWHDSILVSWAKSLQPSVLRVVIFIFTESKEIIIVKEHIVDFRCIKITNCFYVHVVK
jgi:hypothetical protein